MGPCDFSLTARVAPDRSATANWLPPHIDIIACCVPAAGNDDLPRARNVCKLIRVAAACSGRNHLYGVGMAAGRTPRHVDVSTLLRDRDNPQHGNAVGRISARQKLRHVVLAIAIGIRRRVGLRTVCAIKVLQLPLLKWGQRYHRDCRTAVHRGRAARDAIGGHHRVAASRGLAAERECGPRPGASEPVLAVSNCNW